MLSVIEALIFMLGLKVCVIFRDAFSACYQVLYNNSVRAVRAAYLVIPVTGNLF